MPLISYYAYHNMVPGRLRNNNNRDAPRSLNCSSRKLLNQCDCQPVLSFLGGFHHHLFDCGVWATDAGTLTPSQPFLVADLLRERKEDAHRGRHDLLASKSNAYSLRHNLAELLRSLLQVF